jgi:Carboxypeptidase regulatory-like domain
MFPGRRSIVLAVGLAACFRPALSVAQAANTPPADAGYRIAGTVVNALGGSPLAQARITIFETANPRNASSEITSEDGRFEFKQLPAGKYALQGAKRGFIAAGYDEHEQFSTAIVTGAGLDTEHLVLRLSPFAVLSGKVLDEAGDPVRQAMVSLYREDRQTGVGRILKIRGSTTDDQGSYEFTPLIGGTYFLVVSAVPWYAVHPAAQHKPGDEPSAFDRSLDVAYPITYYKDATEPDEASPIPIRGGDRVDVDVHLNPVPALRLLFHVARGYRFPVLQEPSFDGAEPVPNNGGVEAVSPGVVALTGVPAGHYTVRAAAPLRQTEAVSEAEISVSEDGQEFDAAKGEPVSSVKAAVQLGSEALPKRLMIALRNSRMRVVAGQAVDEKGEVEFRDVTPGKYELLVQGPDKAYSVTHISLQGGGEISGNILNVAAGASLSVSLTLVGSTVRVEGFVKRKGQAAAGAMVVLVPKNPEANRRLFRRDQSDLDGSFSLQGVIPGTYTIVAIENGWDLDWSSPGVIAHYCKRGQAVTVGDVGQGAVRLADVVELQPR